MSPRFAVYFAPARFSPWWLWGAHWLGRDEHDDEALAQPQLPGCSPTLLQQATAAARRYGFHATLKAPFRLRAGVTPDHVWARLRHLAQDAAALPLGPMEAVVWQDFVAVVPASASPALATLAQRCVRELDELRAPLSEAERQRRGWDRLDERARELVERFGYDRVLERFQLHFSLSGAADAATCEQLRQAALPAVDQLNATSPLCLDRLCLFVESAPGAPLRRWGDALLCG